MLFWKENVAKEKMSMKIDSRTQNEGCKSIMTS
jgi:hypothetical protein